MKRYYGDRKSIEEVKRISEVFFLSERHLPQGIPLVEVNFNEETKVYESLLDQIISQAGGFKNLMEEVTVSVPEDWKGWIRVAPEQELIRFASKAFKDEFITGLKILEYTSLSNGTPYYKVKACKDLVQPLSHSEGKDIEDGSKRQDVGERRLATPGKICNRRNGGIG